MIVVPALSKSQHCHKPLVAAAIVGLELAFAEGVADGIDTKAKVVHEENAHAGTCLCSTDKPAAPEALPDCLCPWGQATCVNYVCQVGRTAA